MAENEGNSNEEYIVIVWNTVVGYFGYKVEETPFTTREKAMTFAEGAVNGPENAFGAEVRHGEKIIKVVGYIPV